MDTNKINYSKWYSLIKKIFDATEPRKQRKSKKDMIVCILNNSMINLF